MFVSRCIWTLTVVLFVSGNMHYFKGTWDQYDEKYSHFPESERRKMLEETREMFTFGYDNYMKYAFPDDELDPIHCTGRGPDHLNPSNININDALGDYALTLVDTLDTLAIMGNQTEFRNAVRLVIENVDFDKNSTVQVFEATIRVLGGLLSAHLLITDSQKLLGDMSVDDYDDELLSMAHDLAGRLLPAFDNTATGIPWPRVNLQTGVPANCVNETCTSGAGTLLLEFGLLSHLLEDPTYESIARRAMQKLWSFRSNVTGLVGNVINIQTGEWIGRMSGLGAGLDSFYEYLLKSFILFGNQHDMHIFTEFYDTVKYYMRKGRKQCNSGSGFPPIYVNVNMGNGDTVNNWIDSLQAAWPGVQVLLGDIEEAICMHALYYTLWRRFESLPERFNWHLKAPEVMFYPLRPELIESTYMLYRATKNPFYLHVGKDILKSIANHTKVKCGYATIHDVNKKDLEDRMESFFLSETCKYLFLLFDEDNPVNKHSMKYIFTTEGHLFPIDKRFRKPHNVFSFKDAPNKKSKPVRLPLQSEHPTPDIVVDSQVANFTDNCESIPEERQYFLPIQGRYLNQMASMFGLQ